MALIVKNIKTHYGAIGDGVTDDSLAFRHFQDDMIATQGSDDVQLNIPAGAYWFAINRGSAVGSLQGLTYFCKGVNNLTIVGDGSATTILDSSAQNVSNAVVSVTSPPQVRLTVSTTGWITGQTVTVSGILGTTEANGTRVITVIDATHVDLQGTTFANAYVSGGTVGGRNYSFGGEGLKQIGIAQATGQSARIETVSAGSTTVTLTAASFAAGYISRFSVGNYMMIGGLNIQDLWQSPSGFPNNLHWFEFAFITNINTGTGAITFTSLNTGAGLQYSYKSTWPLPNSGSAFQIDAGGPATIYALDSTWNPVQAISGLTLKSQGQLNNNVRTISYDDIVAGSGGQQGPIPSQNQTWTVNDADYTGITIENDKLIQTMILENVTVSLLKYQSSSIDNLIANNLTVTNSITGTPKNATIDNSNITSFAIGAYAYGSSDFVTCRSSIVGAVLAQGINQGLISASHYTMSNGIISFPFSAQTGSQPSGRIFVPGHCCFWSGTSLETIGSFKVLDITQDPWPGPDYQTTSTLVTISSGSPNLTVSGSIFAAGDVNKIIGIPGAGGSGTVLWAQIIAFIDSQHVTLDTNASVSLLAATKTVEWGTANVHVQTNLTGGIPTNALGIRTVPALGVTFTNCTGSAAALSLSRAPANRPLWSYSNYLYSSPTYAMSAAGNLDTQKIWGRLVSLKVNVTTPYAGAGSATLNVAGQFHNFTVKADNSVYDYKPVINLKFPGERVITPSGVTGTQSGDSALTVPEAIWFTNSLVPWISADLSSSPPVFTIEIMTDQGPDFVAPLKLRIQNI